MGIPIHKEQSPGFQAHLKEQEVRHMKIRARTTGKTALMLSVPALALTLCFAALPADAAPAFSQKSAVQTAAASQSVPQNTNMQASVRFPQIPNQDAGEEISFAEIMDHAQRDDPEMQFLAGLAYDRGDRGVNADPQMAAYWYERSASHGYPMAKAMLAYHYHTGYGYRTDRGLAISLWTDAIPGLLLEYENGNIYASLVLDLFYYRDRGRWHPRARIVHRPLPPRRYYYDYFRRVPYPPRYYRSPYPHRRHPAPHWRPPRYSPPPPPKYGPPKYGPPGGHHPKPKPGPPKYGPGKPGPHPKPHPAPPKHGPGGPKPKPGSPKHGGKK